MRTTLLIGLVALLPAAAQDAWPPLPSPRIVLRGSEHSGRFLEDNPGWPMHLVTLFLTAKNVDSAWHTPQQHLEWAHKPSHSYVADGTGAFVIIAHPTGNQFDQIVGLPELDAMEVSHGGSPARFEELWDRVLTWRLRSGLKPIWGTGADDTHSITNIDRSWIAMRIPELTEAAVKRAVRTGGFYVSNGPMITDVQVRGQTIEVATAEPADIRWVRSGQFGIGPAAVGREPGQNRCLKLDTSVTRSSYTLTDEDGTTDARASLFVRCIVTTSQAGKAAQTQPFVIRPAGSIGNPYPAVGRWHKGMTHNHGDYPEGGEQQVLSYHAAYAAKGHAAAFETPYEYWLTPIANYPTGRAPWITRVEPQRISKGGPRKLVVLGSGFAAGAKVLLEGRIVSGTKKVSDGRIDFAPPRTLAPGVYEVTVLNPDNLQHTLQQAVIVQPPETSNEGWTHFTPFNSKLGSLHTYTVAADPERGVWVGTNYGISRFDGKEWSLHREFAETGSGRLDNVIYDFAVDPDRTAWFTCLRGVGALHPDGRMDRWDWKSAGFPRNQVNQILRVADTTYVTMHNLQGLFALRQGRWGAIPVRAGGTAVLHAIVRDGSGNFWFGTSNGLLRWEEAKGLEGWTQFTAANSGLPDNFVRRLALDRAGALWIATAARPGRPTGGLVRLKDGKWTIYDPSNSRLPERRVWSVFADSKDRIWAATSLGVACLDPDGSWRVYNTLNSGLAADLVTDVAEDREGNLWFTTANGVSRLDARFAARPVR